MSKKSLFRRSSDKKYGKCAQALLKPAPKHLYHIPQSLPRKLSSKTSLFLTCQILGPFVNTLTTDEKYPLPNRENLTIPIQVKLSQNEKSFSEFFAAVFKSTLNFEHFGRKHEPHSFYISEITDSKNVVR